MSYIGRDLRTGAFRQLDDISSGFDGSDTTHTMQVNSTNVSVGDVNQILLSLGGVIQKPGTDFTVSGSTLTFTTAPAANTSFFAILLGSDNGGTVTPTDGSVTTGKIVDDAVTAAKVASSGAFAIGAAGTASSLAGIPFYNGDTTSIYTHDVSGTDDTASNNTAYGIAALDAVTQADNAVCIGYNAGTAMTTGGNNTIIGSQAGESLTSGGSNMFIGRQAGDGQDTENHNVGIGRNALGGPINGGEYNVAVGNSALSSLTSSDANVAVGYEAGKAITGGGDGVVVIGYQAGVALTDCSSSVFIGYQAGDGHDDEDHNIAIGRHALGGSVAGGEYNIAIGSYVLDAATSGDGNVAVGYAAAGAITTGNYNTAIGYASMTNGATTGAGNSCLGQSSGYNISSGQGNTFVGDRAGYQCTTSEMNTAIGIYAGYNLTTGTGGNTTLGYASAYNLTTGINNTVLGYDAGRPGSPGGNLVTTSHNICLGDDRISACHVQVDWTIASDQRDKTDFTALDLGLDFVNDLKPYTYKWDKRSRYGDKEADDYDLSVQTPDGTHKEDWLDIGFKAQEVEALEKAAGYKIADKTNLTTSLSEDGKQYGIKYTNFVPILVKAVQELSAKVKALEEA